MSDLIDLPREQVHIWIAAVQDWVETSAFQDLLDTLNSEERNRASRFAFDRDREVYTLCGTACFDEFFLVTRRSTQPIGPLRTIHTASR